MWRCEHRKESEGSVDNNVQLALRSETRQRSGIKTDLEESTCGMSFLYALIKHPNRSSPRDSIISPFFFSASSRWNLRCWSSGESSPKNRATRLGQGIGEDTGMRKGTSSISKAYVQSTFCACMHSGTK